ncbi:NAD(P)-binding protein [Thelephora ganbajun]|uniref:NAD(P)-binding protein n=1 Tax=Thelephora ganbajun TaxID=370292 RepID=A0ACB6ZG05_THEGA|nr:NAD(P)-binding protein [Thelephora ganbajun]
MASNKVVVCGAGFLGSHFARAIASSTKSNCQVQISSRHPQKIYDSILRKSPELVESGRLLPPVPGDITRPDTLKEMFKDASTVISLVGLMHGSPEDFDRIQHRGAENVARAAQEAGAKLIHFSAIGADIGSDIPYFKTKGLGEKAVLVENPKSTIVRPSLVFGPGDGFFSKFATMSSFMPFLPVFAGGTTKLQPVYVGDLASLVEIISRNDPALRSIVDGKIVEAGGPNVLTYYEMMEIVLKCKKRYRPILSLPYAFGIVQGFIMEKLPENIFTLSRDQVKQLKLDNIVKSHDPSFRDLVEEYTGRKLASVHDVLPTYL